MSQSAIDKVEAFHAEVDIGVSRLEALHGERLTCHRGCHSCCLDGITVLEVEAARIRAHHADLLATGTPNPEGACAFLDHEGACRIYPNRPYVCRTQGLPFRWLEPTGPDEGIEYRDICPLNEAGTPVEHLPPDACWTLGSTEERLAGIQEEVQGSGADLRRLALRSLFAQANTT